MKDLDTVIELVRELRKVRGVNWKERLLTDLEVTRFTLRRFGRHRFVRLMVLGNGFSARQETPAGDGQAA